MTGPVCKNAVLEDKTLTGCLWWGADRFVADRLEDHIIQLNIGKRTATNFHCLSVCVALPFSTENGPERCAARS